MIQAHICADDRDTCWTCLKFDRAKLRTCLKKAEEDAEELKRLLGQIAETHCFYTCPSDAEVEGIHEAICHDVKTKLGIPLEKGP